MKVGSWRVVPKSLSKSNSDEAVLSFSMKRTEDKAENIFKKKVSVRLTKSSDEDKIRLPKYYLQKKGRIRQQHKVYYNNKTRIRDSSKNNRKKHKIRQN